MMKLLINNTQIDWRSKQSHYFFNPQHPQTKDFKKIALQVPVLKSHIYLYSSSGSKICLLSKKALLYSAHLANQNLQASFKDKWLISLPFYHVSGLSILARAFLSGSSYSIQDGDWSPSSFKKQIEKEKITLSSLVPTQVYDLLKRNLKAPSDLRALLVGGDHLSPLLYKKARDLGWPLLPCYGMTETCSHIAVAKLSSLKKKSPPEMSLLEGIELEPFKKTEQAFFKIKSEGLLTAYFDLKRKKLFDPKDEKGRLLLEDRLSLKKKVLEFHSSSQDQIKILGEKVNLKNLRFKLQKILQKTGQKGLEKNLEQNPIKAYLVPFPEERRGWNLVLFGEIKDFEKLFSVREKYNEQVSAYEKIQSLYFLDKEPQKNVLKLKPKVLLKKLSVESSSQPKKIR